MIKDVLDGIKEVVIEVSIGMKESFSELSSESKILFSDLEVKLMGSYEEIEAHEKAKATEK
ncbi:MAG TPA: hypothetical protein EYG94_09295 [Campylobacterales bacterium]|nr:hypothetical protein [Campylobacterales bacterium]